jgi:nucleotide-binding universal stress UspA family protein
MPRDRRIVLLCVIDTRPAEEMGYISRSLHGGPGRMSRQGEIVSAADTQTAGTVLGVAEARCIAQGFASHLISKETRRGRPEQEILQVAGRPDLGIGLVVIGSAYKREGRHSVGPVRVGHVARFVAVHCPCDVLVLR